MTVLSGRLAFSTAMLSEPLVLQTGAVAICGAHVAHRVKALEDSAFLLVMGSRV